jgi:hypothetical protein
MEWIGGGLVFGIFVLIAVLGWMSGKSRQIARDAEDFADRTHQRLNGFMSVWGPDKQAMHARDFNDLKHKVNHEVFGIGRSGEYPDMGLRDWCREWRGRLRNDVARLRNDAAIAEHRFAAIESLPEIQKAFRAHAIRQQRENEKAARAIAKRAKRVRG